MPHKNTFYPESKFGGFSDIDGTIVFYGRINALCNSSYTMLDYGCGRGDYSSDNIPWRRNLRIFKGKVKKVIGVDIDDGACENPYIDEFHHLNNEILPLENDSVDVVICDNVLEHLGNPDGFFTEAHRVMKNEGIICIRSPNLISYFGLFSKLIPNKFHKKVISMVKSNKDAEPYHTYYRCNTISKIRRQLERNNFCCVVYGYEAEPSYLSFSHIAYAIGVLHQKIAPNFFKLAIFAFGRLKKTQNDGQK